MIGHIDVGSTRLQLGPWPTPGAHFDQHWCLTHTWHDGAPAKASVVERIGAHGSLPAGANLRESVLVTLQGWSWGSSRTMYQQLRNELAALQEVDVATVRLVDDLEDTRRVGQVVRFDPVDDRGRNRFSWAIDIRCPDPRRYGVEQGAGQGPLSWYLSNAGATAPSAATVSWTVGGTALSSWSLASDDGSVSLSYVGQIASGAVVEVLAEQQMVLINGSLAPIQPVGGWPVLAPGQQYRLTLTTSHGVTADCRFAPAWW